MSVTASSNNGWTMGRADTQLHPGRKVGMQVSAAAGYGQAVFYDAAGNVALNDGITPNLVCAGVITDRSVTGDAIAGHVAALVHQGEGNGQPASTIASDAFVAADVLAVAYDAGNGVPGKLSNYGGKRSIMGLCLGLDGNGKPNIWAGPEASLMARALLAATSKVGAWIEVADGSAGATLAEFAIHREPLGGVVTAIEFTGAAIAADNTDYITLTVSKRDGAGGGAVVLGTYDSRAANNGAVTAFTPAAFTLSVVAGALNLLPTDIVTFTEAKGASGKVVTGSVRLVQKVI